MRINWALRLKNRTTFYALIGVIVSAVYSIFAIFGIVPSIGEDQVLSFVSLLITLLVGLGVLVDPTTEGISDSCRALDYRVPAENANTDEGGEC